MPCHAQITGEGHIALAELLMAQTTAKQMALRDGGGRSVGTFMFDVREYREDAVDDEQVRSDVIAKRPLRLCQTQFVIY